MRSKVIIYSITSYYILSIICIIFLLIYAVFQGLEHEKRRVEKEIIMEQLIEQYRDLIEREKIRLEVTESGQDLIKKMEEYDNAME